MEYYRVNPDGNLGLSEDGVINYKFEIKRSGDLVSDIYMVFTLPDIFSSGNTNFQWIKNIGFNIINKVSIYIGNSLIDENYGEWFNIWNELTLPESKRKEFDEMIGNVPELYDPENATSQGYYPNRFVGNDTIPSIKSRKIRVPLIFWFNRNYSLALPLVALQYYPVEINIEMRRITDLYTVIETETTAPKFGTRIKPLKTNANYQSRYSLVNFVKDSSLILGEGDTKTIKNFNIDIYLDVVKHYPDRIKAIYIRTVNHKKRMLRIQRLIKDYTNVPVLLFKDSEEVLEHARKLRLIC